MNNEIVYRLYQDAYNEEMKPFLTMKNGTPLYVFETTDGMEGRIRQKFAENIVRECITSIQMGMARNGRSKPEWIQSSKHIKDIKEKFDLDKTPEGML